MASAASPDDPGGWPVPKTRARTRNGKVRQAASSCGPRLPRRYMMTSCAIKPPIVSRWKAASDSRFAAQIAIEAMAGWDHRNPIGSVAARLGSATSTAASSQPELAAEGTRPPPVTPLPRLETARMACATAAAASTPPATMGACGAAATRPVRASLAPLLRHPARSPTTSFSPGMGDQASPCAFTS